MATTLVGLVGWRGMVGSVLMDRMQAEGDFAHFEPLFFSTSNAGGAAPAMAKNETTLKDAFNIDELKRCDIVITAQGGDYTNEVYPKLRAAGWVPSAFINAVSAGRGPVTWMPSALAWATAGSRIRASSSPKSPPSEACGFRAANAILGVGVWSSGPAVCAIRRV